MTFSLTAAGTREQVRQQLDAQLAQHIAWKNEPAQLQAVIDLIGKHLESRYPGGLLVESNGHLDQYSGALNLTIKPLNLPAQKEGQL
jgi:hypothetical protein